MPNVKHNNQDKKRKKKFFKPIQLPAVIQAAIAEKAKQRKAARDAETAYVPKMGNVQFGPGPEMATRGKHLMGGYGEDSKEIFGMFNNYSKGALGCY